MTQTVIAQATGDIDVEGDSDWFKVTLSAGNEYVFNIGSGTLGSNGSLAIYDSSGNQISSVSSGSQIVFEPTTSGTYFVGASGSGASTGTYTITESAVTYDFLGNINTTGTVAVGGTATGALTTTGQADWFKVTLTAGTGYALNVSSNTLSGAQVALYDSNGNLIETGNQGDTLSGNTAFFVPTTSGTYYVAASDTRGGTGAFTVSVATASYDVAGNISTTGTVAVGGTATGNLTNIGQSDWFKVSLTAGKEYVFDLTGNNGLFPAVTVYNAAGTAVTGTSYTGGASGGALTTFEPITSGTYYVGAGSNISTTGPFTLAVSTATPDYLGTPLTTGTVNVGGSTSGNITTQTQSDWFKVTLSANAAYEIAASGGTLSGATVTIYDSNGNALTTGASQTLFEPTSTGTYYVGAGGSGTGTFTVSVATATVDHLGTVDTTGALSVGHSLTGTLAHIGQSDWYKVSLTAGTQYVFTETGGTLSTPLVAIYNSAGTEVALSADGGAGGTSVTSYTPSTTGTYFVSASGNGSATGTYTLTAASATDDYTDTTATTGTFSAVLSVAAAIADNTAGTLASGSKVVDYAANVQTNLDGLEALVSAGKVSSIFLLDSTTPTITVTATQIATDAAALDDITTPFTLNISGYSSALSSFVQHEGLRYIPGTSNSGSNQVIEISSLAAEASPISLGSGFNAIIIDGSHSTTAAAAGQPDSFSFNVQADGTLTLLDNNTGHSEAITGDSYLIFNGAAYTTNGAASSFNSMYFIAGSTDAQITSLYNAAFLRQPDLGGLEFYAKLIGNGSLSLHQAAVYFLASPEFQSDYPTAAEPSDDGGLADQAFITTLYNNVLHRTPDTSEIDFYANALASGNFDRASLLEFFASSAENQDNISGFVVNTSNGAYADSSTLLSASTVLSQVSGSSALNAAAIAPSSIGSGISTNGISIAANDAITLTSSAPTETVHLSSTFSAITIENSGSTIFDAAGGSTITLTGAINTILYLTSGGGSDVANLSGGTGTTVNGFTAGSGTVLNITGATSAANVQLLNGASTAVSGSSLTFGAGTSYVVEIGTVTDLTAATAAAVANKAYAVTGAANETITFLAQDASGNTQVWAWSGVGTNTDHQVDASELTHIVTIAGVAPTALSVSDIG
jgi:hypothetical protein